MIKYIRKPIWKNWIILGLVIYSAAVTVQIYYCNRLADEQTEKIAQLQSEKAELQVLGEIITPVIEEDYWTPITGVETRIDENHTPADIFNGYVEKFNFSLDFYGLAVDYGIDPSFALATWAWETGWGSSDLWINHNNPAGITCGIEYCSYDSKEQGLQAMFSLLRYYINDLGRNTVLCVRELWSESNDADSIVKIMLEINERREKPYEW